MRKVRKSKEDESPKKMKGTIPPHVAGPQPEVKPDTFFRATTPRKLYKSTDPDLKPA